MKALLIIFFVVSMGHGAESIDLSPQKFLLKAIAAHNEKVTEDKDWIIINNGPIKIQGEFVDVNNTPNGVIAQFDFRAINYVEGKTLIESNAGFGDTLEDAKKDAYKSFLGGSFHTLLAGLCNHKCAQVESETVTINGKDRQMYQGGVQIKSKNSDEDKAKFVKWHDVFMENVKSSKLSDGHHWIRIYVAQLDNKIVVKECLLDNEEWEHGKQWMELYEWPKQKEFYSVRYFVMIK